MTTGVSFLSRRSDMLKLLLWCILFVFCWPLAILALIAYPFIWLITLPFRIIGISVGGALALIAALIYLPARILRGPNQVRI